LLRTKNNSKLSLDLYNTMRFKIFLFVFIAPILFAQSGNEILKKVQAKFNSITSFSAGFSQSIFGPDGKPAGKENGTFVYKRKNKFIVDQKRGMIISDSESVWNYDKKNKKVVISTFFDEPTSFSIERFIFDYPSQCRVKFVKEESSDLEKVILLTPRDEQLDLKEIKIWINNSDMVVKLQIVDLIDMKYIFSFSDIKENPEVSDLKFNFTPPKGTKIIDLR